MKFIVKISLLLLLVAQSSCDELRFYNCNNCTEDEPYDCELEIDLAALYNAADSYQVTVYQGKTDDNIILYEEEHNANSFTLNLPLNSEYSVKVVYTRGSTSYISVNSVFPKVEYLEDYCETPCYIVTGNKINMRIKYY